MTLAPTADLSSMIILKKWCSDRTDTEPSHLRGSFITFYIYVSQAFLCGPVPSQLFHWIHSSSHSCWCTLVPPHSLYLPGPKPMRSALITDTQCYRLTQSSSDSDIGNLNQELSMWLYLETRSWQRPNGRKIIRVGPNSGCEGVLIGRGDQARYDTEG